MAYLIERKSQTIFVTGTSIVVRGKPRRIVIESRPEYAVARLAGLPEGLPVPWEEVYAAAKRRQDANAELESQAMSKANRLLRSRRKSKAHTKHAPLA